jgi:hypothetical protein
MHLDDLAMKTKRGDYKLARNFARLILLGLRQATYAAARVGWSSNFDFSSAIIDPSCSIYYTLQCLCILHRIDIGLSNQFLEAQFAELLEYRRIDHMQY